MLIQPGKIYRHKGTSGLYKVLSLNLALKHPVTGEWVKAVLYEAKDSIGLTPEFVRTQTEFVEKFELEPDTPKFKVGDILRYDDGSTALFRVESISPKHGGLEDRYYGRQCFGGSVGAYASDCLPASEADLKKWAECNPEKP